MSSQKISPKAEKINIKKISIEKINIEKISPNTN